MKDNHLRLFEDFVMFVVGGGGGEVEDVLLLVCYTGCLRVLDLICLSS